MKSTSILVALCAVLVVLTNRMMAQGMPSAPLVWQSNGEVGVDHDAIQTAGPPSYCSPCLFYGGDSDIASVNFVPFANGVSLGWKVGKPPAENIQVYSAFTVPKGKTWTVTGLFSNVVFIYTDVMDPSTPRWSIRSGMKAGDGGKIIASGTTEGTATPTGRNLGNDCGGNSDCPEYTILVQLPKPVKLTSGTYYESVEPLCTTPQDPECATALFYLSDTFDGTETTQGAHAYGPKEPKGQNFQNSLYFGVNYVQIDEAYCTSNSFLGVACDWMSDGVIGTEQ